MDGLDFWRLCEELTIVQAALLIADSDPGLDGAYVEGWETRNRPVGYESAKIAILTAFRRGAIAGRRVPQYLTDVDSSQTTEIEDSIDISKTTVEVESLRAWLKTRGVKPGFFFPATTDEPDYLVRSPKNARYAPKLAAAVRAWQAVTETNGKSPKQALIKWLREHAHDVGLCDEDGKPNDQGIEECAKVANWEPSGGAPKTPIKGT